MFKYKLITFAFFIKNLFAPSVGEKKHGGFKTARNGYNIERVAQLSDTVQESSALEIAKEGKTLWTCGDSGTKSHLYEINNCGNVVSILNLPLRNFDWEDLTKDENGFIYLSDTGNNYNTRKNLCIYKFNPSRPTDIDTIHFVYEDQIDFPPVEENMNYDCEALLYYKDSLYLFSKNRGDKWVKVYSLPSSSGTYTAKLVQKIFMNSMITAADINPDNKTVALLSYGKIYFLHVIEGNGLKLQPSFTKKFNRSYQSEGLVFINNTDMIVNNEQGMMFKVRKRK